MGVTTPALGQAGQPIYLPQFLSSNEWSARRSVANHAVDYAPVYDCIDWTTNFIAKPHPAIGRPGSICPRVPQSLKADSLYWGLYHQETIDEADAAPLVGSLNELFLALEPTTRPQSIFKALLLVMPHNSEASQQSLELLQRAFKEKCLQKGILLGKFHAQLRTTALNNPDFRPGLSPYPILAFRYAVETDIRFMLTTGAPAQLKIVWIRAFLDTMGEDLSLDEIGKLKQEIERLDKQNG